MSAPAFHRPYVAIAFMCAGMFCISINDMSVKSLSGGYALYQLVFLRALIGLAITSVILQREGGFAALRVRNPWLHVLRGVLIVFANSCFYAALVVMPIAQANAIYFIAPLIVTLLSIPVLGETVGPRRIAAISLGFVGVLIIIGREVWAGSGLGWIVILPALAAMGYGTMSVLTRKLGAQSPASVLSFWVQAAFLLSAMLAYVLSGQGQLQALGQGNPSADFLLRPWIWPAAIDWPMIALLGLLSGIVGYTMSQAYRLAPPAVVAPFEYTLMIYGLFWGWTVFGEWPGAAVFVGAAIIIGSGLYIVWRERGG